jgi:hypothetical protein
VAVTKNIDGYTRSDIKVGIALSGIEPTTFAANKRNRCPSIGWHNSFSHYLIWCAHDALFLLRQRAEKEKCMTG